MSFVYPEIVCVDTFGAKYSNVNSRKSSDLEKLCPDTHNFRGYYSIRSIESLTITKQNYTLNEFIGNTNLQNISNITITGVSDVSGMFQNCTNLQTIGNMQITKLTHMNYLFANCKSLQSINKIHVNSTFIYENGVFEGCKSLCLINDFHITRSENPFFIFNHFVCPLTINHLRIIHPQYPYDNRYPWKCDFKKKTFTVRGATIISGHIMANIFNIDLYWIFNVTRNMTRGWYHNGTIQKCLDNKAAAIVVLDNNDYHKIQYTIPWCYCSAPDLYECLEKEEYNRAYP